LHVARGHFVPVFAREIVMHEACDSFLDGIFGVAGGAFQYPLDNADGTALPLSSKDKVTGVMGAPQQME